jgi:hypothetical protein
MRNGNAHIITAETASAASVALIMQRVDARKMIEMLVASGLDEDAEFWRAQVEKIGRALADLGHDPEAI